MIGPFPWWHYVLAAYAAFVVVAVGTILLQRRSPTATLSWIFAFVALPFVSGAFYLVFGPRRVERRRQRYGLTRRSLAHRVGEYIRSSASPVKPNLSADASALAKVVSRLGQGDPSFATVVKVLDSGDTYVDSLERAMREAKHHIHCEYYIWEPDRVGERFRDLLAEAAARGVQVRVLVDAVGSHRTGARFWKPLVDAGGEQLFFNRLRFSVASLNFANFRTHRKIVVCDGRVGYLGGKNLHDSVSAVASGAGAWRDTHVRIEGEPVRRLQRLFLENWSYSGGSFDLQLKNVRDFFPPATGEGGKAVQILASGPDDPSASIHAFILAAISTARSRVWITTPYFVPDEPLESAMRIAVLRGVEVHLIIPHEGDSRIVTAASRTYCESMGTQGVQVFEYGPPMIHAKTMLIDDTVALVGTANMDNRSFRLNFEVAAAFYDQDVIEAIAANFRADRALSKPYRKRRGEHLSALLESIARLCSPVL